MPHSRPLVTLSVRAPEDFDFRRTVLGHGWYLLPPFHFDDERAALAGVTVIEHAVVPWEVLQNGTALQLRLPASLGPGDRASLKRSVRSCLRLDEDFAEFHAGMRHLASHRWIAQTHSGRLLRAPTVFEDAVKMLCTTNCTWALTETMVKRLVQKFGSGDRERAFPSAEALARSNERVLRTRCTLGYRAPYVLELARRVAGGSLEIESWRTTPLPTDELYATIRSVKGFGPYAAGNLLKLLGRYDYLGLDSWVRARYAALYGRGRKVSDGTIERHYKNHGRWRGLVFWLEMTRHWHEEKFGRKL
jgi:3-methyladenine DNA glycosylase/8-oxoguanine DNA glycosylase